MPCSEKRAAQLLRAGRARVHRMAPFAIRLVDRRVEFSTLQPMRLSLDPGSKTTGVALARMEAVVDAGTGEVLAPVMHIRFLMDLVHRGQAIRDALQSRAALRRTRRGRNLRYRAPRFNNRSKPKGWLAPSLMHRVLTTMTWVRRLRKLAPVTVLAQELVRFDTQLMQNPDITCIEYQQGTLAGYEVREYLLEKFGRACSYCDAQNTPLQIEHIVPKARGGTNRISNLCLACHDCNQRKGALPIEVFLAKQPAKLARIQARAKAPLKDASAVNSTRWALFNTLKAQGLPVEVGTGGQTKFNRARFGIPKSHSLDAACVGHVADVQGSAMSVLQVKCTGRGSHQRTRLDTFGFPRGYLMRSKSVQGFRTGDMVQAAVPAKSKKAGIYRGRVAVRASGSFNIQTAHGVIQGISHRHCSVLMRGDGYAYQLVAHTSEIQGDAKRRALSLPALKDRVSRAIH